MATNQSPALMSARASTAMERSCSFLAGGTDMCRDDPFDAETNPQVNVPIFFPVKKTLRKKARDRRGRKMISKIINIFC